MPRIGLVLHGMLDDGQVEDVVLFVIAGETVAVREAVLRGNVVGAVPLFAVFIVVVQENIVDFPGDELRRSLAGLEYFLVGAGFDFAAYTGEASHGIKFICLVK